jgi:hypothetical protein
MYESVARKRWEGVRAEWDVVGGGGRAGGRADRLVGLSGQLSGPHGCYWEHRIR